MTLFLAASAIVVLAPNIFVMALGSCAVGLQMARLFVLGHDACHQSLFRNRTVNQYAGRVLFLSTLTPYNAWEAGHNLGHHVYTNLRGKDYVWTPMSPREFAASSPWRRALERYYRSGFGFGAYYLVELWWRKLFFASRDEMTTQRPGFLTDSIVVSIWALVWIAALIGAAYAAQQSIVAVTVFGFVVPFLIWGWLMGAVIYFHHTHPSLAWFADPDAWEAARDVLGNTVHVQFPHKLGRLLNNIMDHPAHHLDARIPSYNLEAAHRTLDIPAQIVQPATLRALRDCVTRCKLYDYDAQQWLDFHGRGTAPALARAHRSERSA